MTCAPAACARAASSTDSASITCETGQRAVGVRCARTHTRTRSKHVYGSLRPAPRATTSVQMFLCADAVRSTSLGRGAAELMIAYAYCSRGPMHRVGCIRSRRHHIRATQRHTTFEQHRETGTRNGATAPHHTQILHWYGGSATRSYKLEPGEAGPTAVLYWQYLGVAHLRQTGRSQRCQRCQWCQLTQC